MQLFVARWGPHSDLYVCDFTCQSTEIYNLLQKYQDSPQKSTEFLVHPRLKKAKKLDMIVRVCSHVVDEVVANGCMMVKPWYHQQNNVTSDHNMGA